MRGLKEDVKTPAWSAASAARVAENGPVKTVKKRRAWVDRRKRTLTCNSDGSLSATGQ